MNSPQLSIPDSPEELVLRPPDDPATIHAGIDHFGVLVVLESVAQAVDSADRDAASVALGFLREAILVARHRDLRTAYRHSELLNLVRSKLVAPEHAVRGSAIYTLGKLGPRENARHLRAALPWYAQHDPLRLDQLLFELGWLLGRRRLWRRELLTQLVRSRSYLTRWVTVAILWERELVGGRSEFGSGRSPGWALQLMRILAQDQHSFVREDARRALAERRRHRLQRPVVRNPKGLLADESLEPNPGTFKLQITTLTILVNNYLYGSGEADYDIALVEDVARYSHQNPIRPGYDPSIYWSSLSNARDQARG